MPGEGDERAEAGIALDELASSVDRVDDPHRGVAAHRVVPARIGVHAFLADHDGAGEQRREGLRQPRLGGPVRDRHEVVRAGLLVHLVRGEPPPTGRHFLGRGLEDRFTGGGQERGVVQQVVVDHASITPRPTDTPASAT